MPETPSEQNGILSVRKASLQPEILHLIPEPVARKYIALPLAIKDGNLQVAMANPEDILALEALAAQSRMRIEPQAAIPDEIIEAIDLNYKSYEEIEKKISDISLPTDIVNEPVKLDKLTDAPIAQALTLITDEAIKARASDIHWQQALLWEAMLPLSVQ